MSALVVNFIFSSDISILCKVEGLVSFQRLMSNIKKKNRVHFKIPRDTKMLSQCFSNILKVLEKRVYNCVIFPRLIVYTYEKMVRVVTSLAESPGPASTHALIGCNFFRGIYLSRFWEYAGGCVLSGGVVMEETWKVQNGGTSECSVLSCWCWLGVRWG